MGKMTTKQTELIDALVKHKARFDAEDPRFREQVARALEARMAPIRATVKAAEAEKVPASRIYHALGFTQPAPFNNFMRNTLEQFAVTSGDIGTAFTFAPEADSAPAYSGRKFAMVEDKGNSLIYSPEDGSEDTSVDYRVDEGHDHYGMEWPTTNPKLWYVNEDEAAWLEADAFEYLKNKYGREFGKY